jgi:carbon monoxide dehydrogenase subunit G
MKFESQFTVAQPVERVWMGLLDIPRVASCLPGATLEAANGDGTHRGTIAMKLGPMKVSYSGTARLADVDEDVRVASIDIKARERGGGGTAAATIRNRVDEVGPSTSRVTAETDLRLTGRVAQMGGGMVQEVASGLLDEFARRFERALSDEAPAVASAAHEPPAEPPPAPPMDDADEAFELGGVLLPFLARRGPVVLGGLAVLALLTGLLGRRRRSFRLTVEHAGVTVKLERRR